jgi:NDP-sugar pyrophosphorylase family protein
MKAVLLAAGRGTRLGVQSRSVPKILVEIAGERLLDRQLRYLSGQGVTEVAMNTHHLATEVERYLDESPPPIPVRLFHEPTLRGTAGALIPMRESLTERFLVLYGDVVTDINLRRLADDTRGLAALAYYESSNLIDKGVIELDERERVVRFVEKADPQSRSAYVNAGIYGLDPAILDFVGDVSDFGFDVWPAVAAAGKDVYGHRTTSYVEDVGTPDAIRRVERDIEEKRITW